jgi:hypothetical protein
MEMLTLIKVKIITIIVIMAMSKTNREVIDEKNRKERQNTIHGMGRFVGKYPLRIYTRQQVIKLQENYILGR